MQVDPLSLSLYRLASKPLRTAAGEKRTTFDQRDVNRRFSKQKSVGGDEQREEGEGENRRMDKEWRGGGGDK